VNVAEQIMHIADMCSKVALRQFFFVLLHFFVELAGAALSFLQVETCANFICTSGVIISRQSSGDRTKCQ
jgi:hypothetical protein